MVSQDGMEVIIRDSKGTKDIVPLACRLSPYKKTHVIHYDLGILDPCGLV